ncbi:MAG: hypothetical protein MUF76_11915 [Hydrogenophaga sp.]|nr:hypothetical protein [Hydrogenophaga sp.]
MSNETIEVGYRNIGVMGGVDYYHKFLLYTDSAGNQHTISGWTDPENSTEALPFGNIRVFANTPFDANNPDSPLMHPGQQQHRETIVQGADLSATWAAMVENANSKDNIYPYDPIRQNSNTFADSVLRDAGLRQARTSRWTGTLCPDRQTIWASRTSAKPSPATTTSQPPPSSATPLRLKASSF